MAERKCCPPGRHFGEPVFSVDGAIPLQFPSKDNSLRIFLNTRASQDAGTRTSNHTTASNLCLQAFHTNGHFASCFCCMIQIWRQDDRRRSAETLQSSKRPILIRVSGNQPSIRSIADFTVFLTASHRSIIDEDALLRPLKGFSISSCNEAERPEFRLTKTPLR